MSNEMEKLYNERLERYKTANKNGKPDRVPLRIFAAEFVAKYAGYAAQEVTHDYKKAFIATRKCAKDFNWDSTNINMIYIWTGLIDSIGIRWYKIPGIDLDPNMGFQYKEPKEEDGAYMKADEYDLFIDSPTEFLANVWLPRTSKFMVPVGEPNTYRNNIAWLKGGIGMMQYLADSRQAISLLESECGVVQSVAGILKAPFDILSDKLRGFRMISADLHRRPDKVLAATEAVTPYLIQNALVSADPNKLLPVGLWLHRGTMFSDEVYEKLFWPTLKEAIIQLWKNGIQTLWYGEGDWSRWYKYTAELPEGSIIYHVDKEDIFEAYKHLGNKFCISGGIPNDILAFGTPDDVRDYCKKVINGVAKDGGYIMDASAIIQSDAKIENIKAMTEATLEYGVY